MVVNTKVIIMPKIMQMYLFCYLSALPHPGVIIISFYYAYTQINILLVLQ